MARIDTKNIPDSLKYLLEKEAAQRNISLNQLTVEIFDDYINNRYGLESKKQFENAKQEITRPFPQEEELKTKSKRLDELNIALNLNEKDKEIIADGNDDISDSQMYKKEYER